MPDLNLQVLPTLNGQGVKTLLSFHDNRYSWLLSSLNSVNKNGDYLLRSKPNLMEDSMYMVLLKS